MAIEGVYGRSAPDLSSKKVSFPRREILEERGAIFDKEEDFTKNDQLDRSWWVCRGVSMTPWSEKLIVKPMCEFKLLVDDVEFE
ncbi:hypothetical protein Dimus_001864 [Dionaea muscipula]